MQGLSHSLTFEIHTAHIFSRFTTERHLGPLSSESSILLRFKTLDDSLLVSQQVTKAVVEARPHLMHDQSIRCQDFERPARQTPSKDTCGA
eukprot:SAG11_NODE_1642_length_4529_cov_2.274944_8_plen_91_part_00